MRLPINSFRLSVLFLVLTVRVLAVAPTKPYYFSAPDIKGLLPFSDAELQAFKNRKIVSVTETGEAAHGGPFITKHYLNSDGRLERTTENWKERKKAMTYETVYAYDNAGHLVSVRLKGINQEMRDSIAYDSNGRVVYYYSSIFEKGKRKKDDYRRICSDAKLIRTEGDNYVLRDNADTNYVCHYWMDKNNNVVKVQRYDGIDTVMFITEGDRLTEKRCFKNKEDSVFRHGETFVYEKNLLQSQTRYDMLYEDVAVSKLNYYYDEEGHLVKTDYTNKYGPKCFYTYGYTGLRLEVVNLQSDGVHLTRIEYEYSKSAY